MPFTLRQISPDTRQLADRLQATPIGAIVTYTDLSACIGADVLRRRYLIQRAMRIASREAGALFQVELRVGYRRLAAEQAASVGGHARRRIRSTGRRASYAITRALETANHMPNEALLAATRELSALNLLQHLSRDQVIRKLPDHVKPMPVGQVMAAAADQLSMLRQA